MATDKKWYVTTPIYYVTARPHLGSLYSTLIADVITRWHQLKGERTFFVTGTDEHGQKIAQAAEKAGKQPKEFVDGFIQAYKDTWKSYEISYNHFIRTTDTYHVHAVQQWLTDLQKKGDIYKASYEGWYCTPCETFLTEQEVVEQQKNGINDPLCVSCGRVTSYISEETYFFRLSAYQDRLLKFYAEHPDFIAPKERLNEVINFVKKGLKDLSISRTTVTWGIPFPGDDAHVTYVWADALNNYITAVGYGQSAREKEFKMWWPADVQVLGKDIVRFHAIYWPAFLMASDLALPKQLLVHGWITVADQKMSKSLGNVVDPQELLQRYGADAVRYYLMRHIAVTQDGNFSISDLEQAITSDLANDLGNLLHRMITLALKNEQQHIVSPAVWSDDALALRDHMLDMMQEVQEYMSEYLFHMALARVWKGINQVNAYFHAKEPWKLAKTDMAAFKEVIAATCESLYTIAYVLWPIMPEKMSELLASLGMKISHDTDMITELSLGNWHHIFNLLHQKPLFIKPEPVEAIVEQNGSSKPAEQVEIANYITIDDVIKVELIVGAITACEPVEGSDKLYKMQVDFGAKGMRQILAGIQKYYSVDELIGKQGIFVFNLKPRKMVGLESQGMMLLAKAEDGTMKMATVAQPVPNGTRLQ